MEVKRRLDAMACYSGGNNTDRVEWTYTVQDADLSRALPAASSTLLDYKNVEALRDHMNGARILRSATNPRLVADVGLPQEAKSRLGPGGREIILDPTAPYVLRTWTNHPDGTFGVGEVFSVFVQFTTEIVVYNTPTILIEAGDDDATASYVDGNNTDTLEFVYTVSVGEHADLFDYVDTRTAPYNIRSRHQSTALIASDYHHCPLSLQPEPGIPLVAIKRKSTHPTTDALLHLAIPGREGSISFSNNDTAGSNITIDTSIPKILYVATPYVDGTYGVGETVPVHVVFSAPVMVEGSPRLQLNTEPQRDAVYASGSNSSTLVFEYLVEFGDMADVLDYTRTDALRLNDDRLYMMNGDAAGSIKRASTNPSAKADLTLPIPGQPRTVLDTTSLVGTGHTIRIQTEGFYVTSVEAADGSGTYGAGHTLTFYVHFTRRVEIADPPSLLLNFSGTNQTATCAGASDAHDGMALVFTYTLQKGDSTDLLEYSGDRALAVSSGGLTSVGGASEPVTLLPAPGKPGSISAGATIKVVTSAYIEKVWTPATEGLFREGDELPIVVTFSDAVVVTEGMLRMYMDVHSDAALSSDFATYYGHADSSELAFTYVVGPNNTKTDLALRDTLAIVPYDASVLVMGTNPVVDAELMATCPQDGSFLASQGVVISEAPPTVVRVDSRNRDGTYGEGDVLTIDVHFSSKVQIFGNPKLSLHSADLDSMAPAVITLHYEPPVKDDPLSRITDTMSFSYVVGPDDSSADLNYASTDALQVSALASVRHWSQWAGDYAVAAILDLPSKGTVGSLGMETNIVIDSAAPRVKAVTSCLSDGDYSVGQEIDVVLEFNEAVYLSHLAGGKVYDDDSGATIACPAGSPTAVYFTDDGAFDHTLTLSGSPVASTKAAASVYPAIALNLIDGKGETTTTAIFVGGSGSRFLRFVAYVGAGSSTHGAYLDAGSLTALEVPSDWVIESVSAGVRANYNLPTPGTISSLGMTKALTVMDKTPTVASVFCLLPFSEYGYGAGQDVDIVVEFDRPVYASSAPMDTTLLLDTGRGLTTWEGWAGKWVQTTSAHYLEGSGTSKLTFRYEVLAGDTTPQLAYVNSSALVGDIRTFATHLVEAADLALPEPGTKGSLSYYSRISIDTTAPYVTEMFPLKRGGTYVTNEEIAILVRFSHPVVAGGTPTLELNCGYEMVVSKNDGWDGENGTEYVTSKSNCTAYLNNSFPKETHHWDMYFDFLPTDLIFVYTVRDADAADSLQHADRFAFDANATGSCPYTNVTPGSNVTSGCSYIMRDTTRPTMHADTRLQPNQGAIDAAATGNQRTFSKAGRVERQWTGRMPKKVEVIVRDLWHESAGDLELVLSHGNTTATVVEGVPANHRFGTPMQYTGSMMSDLGGSEHEARHYHGLGLDYIFSDLVDENLALSGVTTQSTTGFGGVASRAVDGNTDGYFKYGSVTHSAHNTAYNDPNPWWQVRMSQKEQPIGTIVLWDRQLQPAVDEIQTVTIRAWALPTGVFSLRVDFGENETYVTDEISVQAVTTTAAERRNSEVFGQGTGESVQSALEAIRKLGRVAVTRREADTLVGHVYAITFLGYAGDVPQLTVNWNMTSMETVGAEIDVDTERPGSTNEWYNYNHNSAQSRLYGSMFPCWVMVLKDDPDPMHFDSLEDALEASVWSTYVESAERTVTLIADKGVVGQYVRVQRADDQYLAVAEVQVYESRARTVANYEGGYNVPAMPISQPFQPANRLTDLFRELQSDGIWTLTVRDSTEYSGEYSNGKLSERNGFGKLSEWVLLVTDQSNFVSAYYMDLSATVVSLPKYGTLFVEESSPSGRWSQFYGSRGDTVQQANPGETFAKLNLPNRREGTRAFISNAVETNWGRRRRVGPCYGTDTTGLNGVERTGPDSPSSTNYRYCRYAGVGAGGSSRNYGVGTVLGRMWTSGEIANTNFLRRERIVYYKPHTGYLGIDSFTYHMTLGSDKSEVEGTVRVNVRNCRTYYSDIAVGTSEFKKANSLCDCIATDEQVYGDPDACPLAVSDTCANEPSLYIPMCVACEGVNATAISSMSAGCLQEVNRVVTLLTDRHLCEDSAGLPMCETETVSNPAPEPSIFYGTATRRRDISSLGNSGVGGYTTTSVTG